MIITIIALLIGAAILCGGIYYLAKEKDDPESRRIYTIAVLAGVLIIAGVILKLFVFGV